jgi:catechol 2,3-dioxygenase-like lactoylglutathione lyase family enzyme
MNDKKKHFTRGNHIGISVSNLDSSIAFYKALTGTDPENVDQIGGREFGQLQGVEDTLIKFATFQLENLNIDLLEYVYPAPDHVNYKNNQISAMHFCFEVEDMDEAVQRLAEIGVKPDSDPITFRPEDKLKSGFGTKVVYFKDPDGAHLELISPKGPFKRKMD